MNRQMEPSPFGERPKGASIWTVLVICLVLAVIGMGALGYALYHANSDKLRLARELEAQQTEATRRELAEQKVGAEAKLTLARNQQELLLAQVGAATNALQQLLAGTDAVRANAAARCARTRSVAWWRCIRTWWRWRDAAMSRRCRSWCRKRKSSRAWKRCGVSSSRCWRRAAPLTSRLRPWA